MLLILKCVLVIFNRLVMYISQIFTEVLGTYLALIFETAFILIRSIFQMLIHYVFMIMGFLHDSHILFPANFEYSFCITLFLLH